MSVWRVTYRSEADEGEQGSFGMLPYGPIIPRAKLEVRDSSGRVIRLMPNSEISVVETAIGLVTEVYGESYIKLPMTDGHVKYRTSCYCRPSVPGSEIHIETLPDGIDRMTVINGHINITEYDNNGREYHIVAIEEGQTALLEYRQSLVDRERYTAAVVSSPDDLIDRVCTEFLDPRKWQY